MGSCFHSYQWVKEVQLARDAALHTLREHRSWRDNNFIGQNLGGARSAYVNILRGRVRIALRAYGLMRISMRSAPFRKAA
jgi:hypothetical protein